MKCQAQRANSKSLPSHSWVRISSKELLRYYSLILLRDNLASIVHEIVRATTLIANESEPKVEFQRLIRAQAKILKTLCS